MIFGLPRRHSSSARAGSSSFSSWRGCSSASGPARRRRVIPRAEPVGGGRGVAARRVRHHGGLTPVAAWRDQHPWLFVGTYLALSAVAVSVAFWSRSPSWGDAHRLALAGGAVLTYAWHAFLQAPSLSVGPTVDVIGDAVFTAGAVALLVVTARRRYQPRRLSSEPVR